MIATHAFQISSVTNESEISSFLSMCSTELETFRYFSSRDISIIRSHIFTYLVYDFDKPIAYYHLEQDDQTMWFGICVISSHQRLGIGQLCLTHLIAMCRSNGLSNVCLTVDLDNTGAMSLYLKNGFRLTEIKNRTVYMHLKI